MIDVFLIVSTEVLRNAMEAISLTVSWSVKSIFIQQTRNFLAKKIWVSFNQTYRFTKLGKKNIWLMGDHFKGLINLKVCIQTLWMWRTPFKVTTDKLESESGVNCLFILILNERFNSFPLQTIIDASRVDTLWKQCGQRRNCSYGAISLLLVPQCFQLY